MVKKTSSPYKIESVKNNHSRIMVLVGIGFLVLTYLVLFLVFNCAFKQEAPVEFLAAKCDFGAFLGFLAACISATATVALAIVSYVQTKWAYDDQRSREAVNTKRPFFVIESVSCKDEVITTQETDGAYRFEVFGDFATVEIVLLNVGDGPANNYRWEVDGFGVSSQDDLSYSCIPAGQKKSHRVSIAFRQQSNKISKQIEYENIIGCKYLQDFTMSYEVCECVESGDVIGEAHMLSIMPLGPQMV